MIPDFTYGLATPEDDAQLRALLARNPVPGMIEITYCREPDYFRGCRVMGDRIQVIVGRQGHDIVGVGQRSSRLMYVNGIRRRVGYLSQLRLDRKFWGKGLTREGFRYGRSLHEADDVPGYITTIIELNRRARAILEKPRDPFPHYHDIGRIYTLALIVRPVRQEIKDVPGGLTIDRGGDPAALFEFLNQTGPQRQFFTHYSADDFQNGRLFGLDVEDVFVVRRAGNIIGTLAYWNQSAFKQTVISGYHPLITAARPFYNGYVRLMGGRPLPPAGQQVRHAYAALTCVQGDDPAVFKALLHRVLRLAHRRGDAYLMVGLHAADPLLPAARALPHVTYRSRLYAVSWDTENQPFYEQLDQRPPYVEIAAL